MGNTGPARFDYFRKVVAVPHLNNAFAAFDFHGLGQGQAWVAFITFFYVTYLNAIGSLHALTNAMNSGLPGMCPHTLMHDVMAGQQNTCHVLGVSTWL